MKPSRESFWRRVAMEFDKLNVALLQNTSALFSEGSREYQALQKTLLREAETEWERRHIRRLAAHNILSFAHFRARTWDEYRRALLRVQRLDYPSLEYRMHAACETLEWAADHDPTKAALGWTMVEETERRLRRLRRRHPVRKQALAALASVKQRVARKGLTPPGAFKRTP
ncbi:hypothetical protein CYFUS_009312 [Cystobacter fuscus]|uniref:Uncharacterized protein n=1 Tax=Cystobacter fuscus TaxID=43 RepID=A0A250JK28_9BACT|nr:hypothetical protein [Cystobacter fuscus]ATB43832.1 hypothetical protein CYFUS_009312 [Cystobacter fuscus]